MSEILAKGFFSWAAVMFCAVNRQPSRCLGSWGIGHLTSEKYLYPIIAAAGAKIKPGAENRAALPLNHLVAKLKEYNAAPPLQGFGISAPDQVKAAIDAGAAGAISGSAIVKIIEQHINEPEKMLAALKVFVQPMKAATRS